MAQNGEECPLCAGHRKTLPVHITWLQCDACSAWYHAECLKISAQDCDLIERYHCQHCVLNHGPTTFKPQPRKSSREHTQLNYADLNDGKTADQQIWKKLLHAKTFSPDMFPRYRGDEVTLDMVRRTGMPEPFVIEKNEGLAMTMPSPDITVAEIARSVGEDRPVEVIDVATQAEQPGWTMGRWAAYYDHPNRDRIRNVISLEISGTDFAKNITRPKIVRDLDWIDHMWPRDLRPKEYPKVQLYCLMGTKDSYTDFHIDFGGSSVFYHIIKGAKIFYFIQPTPQNLKKYQKWSSSPDQSTTFLGDQVHDCYEVRLTAGNTMIIPTGWIHAVYTPEDAIVIGGNFLHGIGISTQLQIHAIEEATDVPMKFRFPYFKRIHWYAALRYNEMLQDPSKHALSERELRGIADMVQWLHKDGAILQQEDNDEERKAVAAHIPTAAVPDPVSLVRCLEERVTAALALLPEPAEKTPLKIKLKLNREETGQKGNASPKLVLKVMPKKEEEGTTKVDKDDDYELEEEEEEEDDPTLIEEMGMDSGDEEYMDDEEPVAVSQATGRKKRSQPGSSRPKQPKDESSDDDDDLGTTKIAKRMPVKRMGSMTGTNKKGPATTVKQRLLNRIKR